MAKSKSGRAFTTGSWWASAFDRRNLLLAETVLVIGLVKEALEAAVLRAPGLPPWLRVIAGMALVFGVLGSLTVLAQRHVARGLAHTQQVVRRLPIPTPEMLVHGAFFFFIFLAYAWYWDGETGAFREVGQGLAWGVDTVRQRLPAP